MSKDRPGETCAEEIFRIYGGRSRQYRLFCMGWTKQQIEADIANRRIKKLQKLDKKLQRRNPHAL